MPEEQRCKGVVWPGRMRMHKGRPSSSQCARRPAAASAGKGLLQSWLTLEITSSSGQSCGNRGRSLETPAAKSQGTLCEAACTSKHGQLHGHATCVVPVRTACLPLCSAVPVLKVILIFEQEAPYFHYVADSNRRFT